MSTTYCTFIVHHHLLNADGECSSRARIRTSTRRSIPNFLSSLSPTSDSCTWTHSLRRIRITSLSGWSVDKRLIFFYLILRRASAFLQLNRDSRNTRDKLFLSHFPCLSQWNTVEVAPRLVEGEMHAFHRTQCDNLIARHGCSSLIWRLSSKRIHRCLCGLHSQGISCSSFLKDKQYNWLSESVYLQYAIYSAASRATAWMPRTVFGLIAAWSWLWIKLDRKDISLLWTVAPKCELEYIDFCGFHGATRVYDQFHMCLSLWNEVRNA